ncbi:alpha/beta hydrolase family protein [Neolewinella litorea]|uniref:Alpha/beta hydrolase n=1 Tax=Neolewinella litorea TaxID=2562452 RepID=A0A4S4NQ03_9BACT|nr:alpha/beta hydrolase [Neolewinella litorea]THH40448.1 alpha/beta hydrolase [Neolewinella litorea]
MIRSWLLAAFLSLAAMGAGRACATIYGPQITPDTLRPQEPVDFPYFRESVRFPGGADTVELAGELTLPTDAPARALAVLISGSGPQDRNQDLGPVINHRPFLVLSDYLTRRGYGVLRYDERGVGGSTGDFFGATTTDFAEDAAAAVAYLRGRKAFRDVPVGLIGHSEGALVAPMVAAAQTPSVDFLILLAAPGLPLDSLMLDQRQMIAGQTPPDQPVIRGAFTYVKQHPNLDSAAFVRELKDTILTLLPRLDSTIRKSIYDPATFAATYARSLSSPWIRQFLSLDPTVFLERVRVPVLALNGEKDTQVGINNLEAVAAALDRGGNPDFTTVALPDLNHLLQPALTGHPNEYGSIMTTLDPRVLQQLTDWLDARY